ncbi:RNA polymerase sigma factor [Aquimarina sp. 2201CG14-23]|uniref:RNA polymerase sigma factor n=1 Tax=Aquimarina mycalae TaxID=3040073 RepID=UPI0024781429|nr:sigma-70 family RNA polymerase sigma factor [Aquimarina sp. 2201CG14-23]MDH7446015.1 sigma-70 family RNA polymerase sigma factor [Aquimarina sp. 2201CG14-23]
MSNPEERKIIEGILAGDETIIKAFYKRNYNYVKSYVLKNSGDNVDAEDVFQDALVLVYQKLKSDSLELRVSVSAYFYGVCKNIWRNRLRKKRKLIISDEVIETNDEIDGSIIEDIENKEREMLYRKYFVTLSDKCKELLNLVFAGNSMREIANITGYSEGYARKKKFECKKSLIEMIETDPVYSELKTTFEKE